MSVVAGTPGSVSPKASVRMFFPSTLTLTIAAFMCCSVIVWRTISRIA